MQTEYHNRLTDAFARSITYLRISVTDRCNLHCRYCAPSRPERIDRDRLLTLEEIERMVRIGIGLGISKIRLTGGEPLMRHGVVDCIARLRRMEGLQDISLTTNGTLISRYGSQLRKAGLSRINISLDTLDRGKFRYMAGADLFDEVWHGIQLAAQLGFSPIKINTVVMRGFNDDEIAELAALSLKYPFHIRFIEYMPIGTDPFSARRNFLPIDEIRRKVEQLGPLMPVSGRKSDGPAVRYRFKDAPGEIGLIGSMSSHFCATCNRMRLTAAGDLRPCLLADDQVNVLQAIRGGATDQELEDLFMKALRMKKDHHQLSFEGSRALHTKMFSIGG